MAAWKTLTHLLFGLGCRMWLSGRLFSLEWTLRPQFTQDAWSTLQKAQYKREFTQLCDENNNFRCHPSISRNLLQICLKCFLFFLKSPQSSWKRLNHKNIWLPKTAAISKRCFIFDHTQHQKWNRKVTWCGSYSSQQYALQPKSPIWECSHRIQATSNDLQGNLFVWPWAWPTCTWFCF